MKRSANYCPGTGSDWFLADALDRTRKSHNRRHWWRHRGRLVVKLSHSSDADVRKGPGLMLGRREFLVSALGAGAAGAVAFSFRDVPVLEAPISPQSHGARGDGVSNDIDAVNKALAEAARTARPI